jgi:HD-like signal output (HDOD) protein
VVSELLSLVTEDEVRFKEVSELIRSDAAVSAEVLRVANSPLLGTWGQVNSVLHAVVVLGLERLKGLILTAALRNYLSPALENPVLLKCWRHNLACGILCETLAGAYFLPKDPCYTAGLLHDVGRLALLSAYPEDYAGMVALIEQYHGEVREWERGVFGLDHCEAGQLLVREWGFPEEFEAITGGHHEPAAAGKIDKVALVRLGCRAADELGFAVLAASEPSDGLGLEAVLPRGLWQRFGSEAELRVSVAEKINALECSLIG